MRQKIIWNGTVERVQEKHFVIGGRKDAEGLSELFTESAGWWIELGGGLSLYIGEEKPQFEIGDFVRLTLEHADRGVKREGPATDLVR